MSDKSPIEWTDATWNPIVGCSILSPGCTHCYAMAMAARIERMSKGNTHYAGTTTTVKGKPVWTGNLALAPQHILTQPLRWSRPRRIFVNSMGDLFHEDVPDAWIDQVFAIVALCPQHTFQVLTKRSARMRAYFDMFAGADPYRDRIKSAMWTISNRRTDHIPGGWPLRNVWLGVSAERQQEADERIPHLLATPAAVRFVSAEPLIGPIDFYKTSATMPIDAHPWRNGPILQGIDWIIVGGESGKDARPMHPDWAREIRDQCADAGVAFFFKQWGEWEPATEDRGHHDHGMSTSGAKWVHRDGLVNGPSWHRADLKDQTHPFAMIRVGKSRAGRLLDGIEHNTMPAERETEHFGTVAL